MIARHFVVLMLALLLGPTDAELKSVVGTITEEECYDHVQVLASMACQGRDTGSPGFELAAEYVEGRLKELGLEGAGPEGSYRLPFELKFLVPEGDPVFRYAREGEEAPAWEAGKDFYPVAGSHEAKAAGEPLFVGYGINARSERWSDMPTKEVRGKVVFAFTREPRADDAKTRSFDGAEATRYSDLGAKVRDAEAAGAVAFVLVPDPAGFPDATRPMPGADAMVVPGPLDAEQVAARMGWPAIPVFSVSRAVAESIFSEDLAEYQAGIDKRMRPRHLAGPKDAEIELGASWTVAKRPVYNLAARIKGEESAKDVVVLGAHLDHVGMDGKAQIYPGADDNASGSAALLEVAEALAGVKPQVDVLFLWFSGEERGLLGSQAYCREPLYPFDHTLCMLNMDMVGRGDARKANVGGLWDRPDWEKLIVRQSKRIHSNLKLDLKQGRDLYARSDQFSFHQHGVPGLFFFEADLEQNKVYHKPGDVAESVDGAKMARIAQLLTATAYAVAVEGERP